MLSKLINREFLSQDEIKSEKKRITGTVSIPLFLLRLTLNDYPSARQVLIDLSKPKISKKHPEVHLGKIFMSITTRNFEEAEDLLKNFPPNPKYSDLLSILEVDLLMTKGQYREVLNLIESLPKTSHSILKSLQANLFLNNLAGALSIIADQQSKYPEHLTIFRLCKAIIKGKYEKALDILEGLPKVQENLEDFHLFKAYVYAKMRNFNFSLDSLHETLALNNKSELAWHLGFIVFFEMNNLADSFYCLNKCLQFNERPEYFVGFSKLYEKAGKAHLAKAFLAKARKIDTEFEFKHEIDFPVLDFSEFCKRKSYFVPQPAVVASPVFVKPQVKISSFKKTKKVKTLKDNHINFEPALILGSLSSSCMFTGTKGNGFKVIPS